jgi:pimeloyl-ACP methyl ester carboxylesterase
MRTVTTLVPALALALAAAQPAQADTARINGLDLYYEVHGSGDRPLVLLHGAFCTIQECFGDMLPALAKSRKVIALELQGHGHTADIDRPLTAANMASDTAALLGKLRIAEADVLGYSMGGAVAIELVRKHPKLVRKLVLIGTPLTRDAWHPGMLDGVTAIDPEAFKQTPWYAAYIKVAPKPEQWAQLVKKVLGQKILEEKDKAAILGAIEVPVLTMLGDSDVVRPEYGVEMFRQFGGGVAGDVVGLPASRLAIVPGATHVTIVHDSLVAPMVTAFLDAK